MTYDPKERFWQTNSCLDLLQHIELQRQVQQKN